MPHKFNHARRGPGLELVERKVPKTGALDIIADSTGLKIFGPGEWLAERQGGSSRREWRKLHLGLDPKSGQLVARDLTPRHVADVTALPGLLNQLAGRIETFLADPAYDVKPTYRLLINRRQGLPLPRVVTHPRARHRAGPCTKALRSYKLYPSTQSDLRSDRTAGTHRALLQRPARMKIQLSSLKIRLVRSRQKWLDFTVGTEPGIR